MLVKVIEPIGFCQSVNNTIERAKEIAKKHQGQNVYVFGYLVHNEKVINGLSLYGIKTIDLNSVDPIQRLNDFNNDDVVIFTAHGHPLEYEAILNNRGVAFYDLTCPIIKEYLSKLAQAKTAIYIGKKNHPETLAALSVNQNIRFIDIDASIDLNGVSADVEAFNQTTINIDLLNTIHEQIKGVIPNAILHNNICPLTLLRQKVLANLSDDIDAIFVVGSSKSSNTKELFETAKKMYPNKQVFFVEDASSLSSIDLSNIKSAAITSGTSTPLQVVEEVKAYLEK